MKLFKKRNRDNTLKVFNEKRGTIDPFVDIRKEGLLEEYANLNVEYQKTNSEEVRQRMIEISEILSPKSLQKQEQKSFNPFKRKEKYEEKYCHTCKHNLILHHKKGRSTGCRKCGCLRTVDEIMNPTDNGHDNKITKIDISEDQI